MNESKEFSRICSDQKERLAEAEYDEKLRHSVLLEEAQVALSEKKPRFNVGAKIASSENAAIFSERAKRAALPPIAESELMRGSMPAISVTSGKSRPKRPARDLKGRIQDMEENYRNMLQQNSNLIEQLKEYNQRMVALEEKNKQLHEDNEVKASQSEVASSQACTLEKQLRENTEMHEKTLKEKEVEISKLREKNSFLMDKLSSLKTSHDNLEDTYKHETTALKSTITSLTCSESNMQAQLEASETLVETLREENKQLKKLKSDKENEIEMLLKRIADLESKLLEEEIRNVILELTELEQLEDRKKSLENKLQAYRSLDPNFKTTFNAVVAKEEELVQLNKHLEMLLQPS